MRLLRRIGLAACLSAMAGPGVLAQPQGASLPPKTMSGYLPPDPSDPCAPSRYLKDDYFPKPAFPQQTRAPAPAPSAPVKVEVLAAGLEHPWSLAFLPDGRFLVTERPGRMRIIGTDGKLSAPITGVPAIEKAPLAALEDVLLDPDFAHNRTLYFNYITAAPGQTPTPGVPLKAIGRTVRARLSAAGDALEDMKVIHEGGFVRRLVWGRDGTLLITSGAVGGPDPQSKQSDVGKVLRINPDGSIPKDNPYLNDPAALPELYAIGFRDPEGATLDPKTGDLWLLEHGPRGGDELQHVLPGRNYGFATISYGREYSGDLINGGKTAAPGLEQPVYFWTPDLAPSGMLFYTGALFPKWRGDLFAGAEVGKHLVHLTLKDGKVTSEESLLGDRCRRIRDVRQGPDGAIYLLTEEQNGELWRLTPGP
jgi:glucose/arabinose dehydrogenase